MNALELISQVEQLGISLKVAGDKLRVKAHVGLIAPEIKKELRNHKAEIMDLLSSPVPRSSDARVYRVIIETNGVNKPMTVISPAGDDIESLRESCNARFGAQRVISINPRQSKEKRSSNYG